MSVINVTPLTIQMRSTVLTIARKILKTVMPAPIKKALWSNTALRRYIKQQGPIDLGDLRRVTPLSTCFGYDRGGPVDRYYIEGFLHKNAALIRGNVLEIGDNEYTLAYGKEAVSKSDILHVNSNNEKATYVGDLSNAPHLPDDTFDCIILTQTLHLIYDFRQAIGTCFRVLKPGGTLLLTVPGISQIDHDEWQDIWLWSFTRSSIKKLLQEYFVDSNVKIETHGNVLTSASFLYGLGAPELTKEELDYNDSHFQLIITAMATKPSIV
ncbi:methyltransferase domain-containing protein [Hymenobacter taeanensis]|uniref:Methyltransferase domain-containing protein n=1 Tax=Hymenobacter taeanensis TaxID=2735321 RepID=A0A6M6BHT7_9BACT|nr:MULTISPECIES: class I SAM-dependent methyltransferase [Hymenobacter]QJX47656.1 methyltransferase domain-containing protein [Hymenobacter taeanensis]UOQ82862.1 methyltransferase domain-containing protein [Hymenobacter sp. 5414T-23]